MMLTVIGCSFRNAPVEVREHLAFDGDGLGNRAARVRREDLAVDEQQADAATPLRRRRERRGGECGAEREGECRREL
jgi:hypothetical protein